MPGTSMKEGKKSRTGYQQEQRTRSWMGTFHGGSPRLSRGACSGIWHNVWPLQIRLRLTSPGGSKCHWKKPCIKRGPLKEEQRLPGQVAENAKYLSRCQQTWRLWNQAVAMPQSD